MTPAISRLFIYPVKSLGGFELERLELDQLGPRLDRRWMVLDGAGAFQTQRWRPRMALISARLTPDGCARLAAPGMPEIIVPQGGGARREVGVWNDTCVAEACGPAADQWLSAFLGAPSRIVFFPETSIRPIRLRAAEALGRVGFADAYPFLLLSEGSLADLNARLPAPLPLDRFRPNIVVRDVEPYAEDGWDAVMLGGIRFVVTKRCVRCVLTTIDQRTAEAGHEPLRTLATYRRTSDGVVFGVNLAHAAPGVLAIGDPAVPLA
ncbi:MAG TPA: MOSC N-terminal beta barrel domain-containing protein [Gemmatimonadales bacterium]|nr:MOSC N-terminal beta barrel domain-containing protein [Gemmatimonadales bacterium]